jgi:hypothetical protein
MIDSVSLYMLILTAVVIPPALFVWYMARRERLAEEAEENAHDASGHAAE